MPRTPADEANWIKLEVEDTERTLRNKGSNGEDYAEAYGRLRIVVAHAEHLIRESDPANGLVVTLVDSPRPRTTARSAHGHHSRREPPKDGLHK